MAFASTASFMARGSIAIIKFRPGILSGQHYLGRPFLKSSPRNQSDRKRKVPHLVTPDVRERSEWRSNLHARKDGERRNTCKGRLGPYLPKLLALRSRNAWMVCACALTSAVGTELNRKVAFRLDAERRGLPAIGVDSLLALLSASAVPIVRPTSNLERPM